MKRRQVVMLALATLGMMLAGTLAYAAETQATSGSTEAMDVYRTVGLSFSAALVAGLSILGAGIAVGHVGSAALGAVAEKPELLARSILFVALAEGLAVLGFAIAMMLLQKMQ
jgi:V/A-type H+/Na+-transporting ATPase subunit K